MSDPKHPTKHAGTPGELLPFRKRGTPPKQSRPYSNDGAFGSIDRTGQVVLNEPDRMEIELLTAATERFGRYVFKHRGGGYGYLNQEGAFVSIG